MKRLTLELKTQLITEAVQLTELTLWAEPDEFFTVIFLELSLNCVSGFNVTRN